MPVKRINGVKFVGILDSEPKIKLFSGCTKEMLGEKKIEFEGVLLPKEYRRAEQKNVDESGSLSKAPKSILKKIISSGLKDCYIGGIKLSDLDLDEVFFVVDESKIGSNCALSVSKIEDDIADSIFYMCSTKYKKDEFILLFIASNFSSGFSFTNDSFCYISNGVCREGKGIFKYEDIKKLTYGDYYLEINDVEMEFSNLSMGHSYWYLKNVLGNICNLLNVKHTHR